MHSPLKPCGTVSVIIPNLHSPIVGDVIAALRVQTLAPKICEIIVVGMDRYGQVQPDQLVQFIRTDQPVSAAAARNLGAAVAQGECLLFVDADCLLAPNAIAELLVAIATGYGAVLGGIVPEKGNYWRLCANLMAFPEFLSVDPPGERGVLPSFCLMLSRQSWEAAGPFTERYRGASAEDLDLSLRLRQAGFRLGCAPSARVLHRPERTSLGAVWQRHKSFGLAFYDIYYRYRAMMPFSEAIWLCEHLPPPLAAAAIAPLALAYALRLLLRRPQLRPFWYALPGMAWAQLGWYSGLLQAARQPGAVAVPESRTG